MEVSNEFTILIESGAIQALAPRQRTGGQEMAVILARMFLGVLREAFYSSILKTK